MIFDHAPIPPLSPFDESFKRRGERRDGSPAWPERAIGRDSAINAAEVTAALARPAKSVISPPIKFAPPSLTQSRRDLAKYKATCSPKKTQPRRINMTAQEIETQEARDLANRRAWNARRYIKRKAARLAAGEVLATRNRSCPIRPRSEAELARERARYAARKALQAGSARPGAV